jgi:hypothetical protein
MDDLFWAENYGWTPVQVAAIPVLRLSRLRTVAIEAIRARNKRDGA